MSKRNKTRGCLLRGIVSAAVATALTVATGGHVGAITDAIEPDGAPAPTWVYTPDEPINDGDIAARAIGESITHEEAERRLRADRAASHLEDVAQARWPETFAGLWIDHDPYRVNVAFTRDAAENVADLRETFPYPGDLNPVDARKSFDALSILHGRLLSERNSLQQGRELLGIPERIRATRGVYDLSIDVPTGRIIVRVERPTPEIRAAFAQRYPGPIAVEKGLAQPQACTQADCRYAMMGGLKLSIGSNDAFGYCSSAFAAYYTADPSIRYILSAGHCYRDTNEETRFNGGSYYGSVTYHRMANEVDAERIRRDSSTSWRESSKFFVQGETYPRMVTSVMPFSEMGIGSYVGKTGYKTGTTRGYISSKVIAPWYVTNARNFVEADMCTYGGDSGGAVWSGNSAYGIVSGAYDETKCRNVNGVMGTTVSPLGGITVYGAVSFATTALGVTILTGVNLRPTADFSSSCLLLQCSFDASASKDDDGGITSYTWDFGDGTTGSGKTRTHSYGLPGLYTVTLTTKDNNAATTSKSVGIVVTSS